MIQFIKVASHFSFRYALVVAIRKYFMSRIIDCLCSNYLRLTMWISFLYRVLRKAVSLFFYDIEKWFFSLLLSLTPSTITFIGPFEHFCKAFLIFLCKVAKEICLFRSVNNIRWWTKVFAKNNELDYQK